MAWEYRVVCVSDGVAHQAADVDSADEGIDVAMVRDEIHDRARCDWHRVEWRQVSEWGELASTPHATDEGVQ